MKKLQVTIMVLMLCTIGATTSRAELVAGYTFEGSLCDCSDNDYHGIPYDGNPDPSGGSLYLDGASSVEIPIPADVFDGSGSFTIVAWFRTIVSEGGCIISSGPPGDNLDDHHMSVFIYENGVITYDNFWTGAAFTATTGLDDDTWHHYACVYDGSGTFTTYIDGDVDDDGDDFTPDLNTVNNTVLIGFTVNTEFPGELGNAHWDGLLDDIGIFDHALIEQEVEQCMEWLPCPYICPCPWICAFDIDPNVMVVYEAGETIGDFDVSLRCEPTGVVTVTVDPNSGNGPNDDLTLIGGSGPQNRITLTFDPNNWCIPQTVAFQAVDNELEEGPDIDENHKILLTTACADPNWNGRTESLTVTVQDNDYVDILFRVTPPRGGARVPVIGPVQLWEQYTASDLLKWRKIFFKMQNKPVNAADPCSPTSVKCQAVVDEVEEQPGGDNLPHTDPCLPYVEADDPNGFTFTSTTSTGETGLVGDCPDWNTGTKTSCWDVPQGIKIWGNDDTVLQIEDAAADGDEDYHAVLIVTVVEDGGDERFTGMERTVQFDIEDNECGAFGISYLDIGNPNAFTDPNFRDEDGNPLPDCYIDIYDVIEMATRWLSCTNPQDPTCQHAQPL